MKSLKLIALVSAFVFSLQAAERPNIVIMMVDDLGFSDFGCYGSEIETPNIDALAANGLRFSRFYNTAKCHSSRVSLLSGLYCDQAGSESLKRAATIPEVLKSAGYSTAMVGKWHLDREPTDRGFDQYFGHLSGATNFFTGDETFRLNGEPWNDFGDDFYTTEVFIDYAEKFVGEALEESPEKPFFLYVAHNAPHYPLQVLEEDYRKYEGRYREGWDVIRQRRYEKQVEMGLIPEEWALSPRPEHVPAWEDMSDEERAWDERRMTAFAGMVDRVDQTTGRLVKFLKDKGVFDNTLIMICSDNGACPFDRTEGAEFEPWDSRSYWCYDTGWSHVGNTPFRLHKQNQHEGGISSPMIAHWPKGRTKTVPGSITHQPAHLVDFMATCLDAGHANYPDEVTLADGTLIDVDPLQGKSLVPIILGGVREPHDFLYFHFNGNRAVRKGPWKLVSHQSSRWELYDIQKDGTELHDLAGDHPEVVEELSEIWHETADKVERLPAKRTKPVKDTAPPLLKKDGRPDKG
ncbi:MAG: arylsulfatase [Verrucomicrobiales bacterium]|nr:arylsulfatase [Verrucomicrobiales bacterium]